MTDARPNVLVGWKAIAAYLGCSVRVAKRHARENALPVSHYDGRVRALVEDVNAWIRKGYQTCRKRA